MATKLTDLAALGGTPASDDLLTIVDVSDTSGGDAGTSKKVTYANLGVGGGTVVTTKVSINNASVLDMKYDDQPITLKAAESGKIIVPVAAVIVATHAGSDESSSDDLRIGWSASDSTTSQYWASARDWMNGVSSGTRTAYFGGQIGGASSNYMTFSITNKPFQIWCTDEFNGGWSMDVYFSYYMVDA
tara:strand:- start:722 stop:1285 length:564 start_codon:yes stop_codon:yes gene_type:complete